MAWYASATATIRVGRRPVHPGAETQRASRAHRAEAVGRQVPDDLPDLVLVGLEGHFVRRHIDLDLVPLPQLGAVPEEERGVVQHPPDVEAGDREALRARVGQERPNRVVQALGLAQHDVHQLRLFVAERQLLTEYLDRP